MVPNLITGDSPRAQLLRVFVTCLKTALVIRGDRMPGTHKLFHFSGDAEIIRYQLLERGRGPRLQGQQSAIIQERFVAHTLPGLQPLCAQPDEAHQVLRESVLSIALIGHEEAVLLPSLVEQRNQPMIEKIEEILRRAILRSSTISNQLRETEG